MVYREDPFQKIVNVGWAGSWAVLAFQSHWEGASDYIADISVQIGDKAMFLFANPPLVKVDDVIYVKGPAPYISRDVQSVSGAITTQTQYTLTVFYDNVNTHGVAYGYIAYDVVTTDGEYWQDSVGNTAATLDDLVRLDGWTSYTITDVGDPVSTQGPSYTWYVVDKNALLFINLRAFVKEGFGSIPVSFRTPNSPPGSPDEKKPGELVYKSALATFKIGPAKFTTDGKLDPLEWFATKVISKVTKNSPDTGQLGQTTLTWSVDLKTLAVTG